jgi:hypothetical protein
VLYANNNEDVQREAASIWTVCFLRAVARQRVLNARNENEVQLEVASICSSCFLWAPAGQHVSLL